MAGRVAPSFTRNAVPSAHDPVALAVSGGLWSLAFAIYLAHYAPILMMVRADGKPG